MNSGTRSARRRIRTALLVCGVVCLTLPFPFAPAPVAAENVAPTAPVIFADPAFRALWRRTDDLAEGRRGYLWGPATPDAVTTLREPYAEAPGGTRLVQYFDKTRMERTNPNAPRTGAAFVTNGLLAREMITGKLQLGDRAFEDRPPARVTIAGDANDANGPTYATFAMLVAAPPLAQDAEIRQTVDRAGAVGSGGLGGVRAGELVAMTNHRTAAVFRDFIFATGLTLSADGQQISGPLFTNGYAGGVGYPITEAYWATVRVGGRARQVLVQAFERRVLTYTPDNPEGFKVEAGNVGGQYLRWRYGDKLENLPAPPGARIAVAGGERGKNAALVVTPADGTRRTALATPKDDVSSPVWTADGQYLAYVSGGQIYRAEVETGTLMKLTGGTNDRSPAWSPDGSRLAYVRGDELAILNVGSDSTITLFKGELGIGSLAWSPDGLFFAFTRGPDVWTVDFQGFGLHKVLEGNDGTTWRTPTWTPDATRLIVIRASGGSSTVVLTGANGGTTRDIAPGTAAALSPNGTQYLIAGANGRVVVTDATGKTLRTLTPEGSADAAPVWSPL